MNTYLKKYPIVKNGFSLLEMLIVVSIVLVLATIAVPKFSSAGDKARDAKSIRICGLSVMRHRSINLNRAVFHRR